MSIEQTHVPRVNDVDIERTFEIFDTDGKGSLDAEEVKLALTALGYNVIPESVLDDFDEAANDDGLLNLEGFRKVLNRKVAEAGSEDEVRLMFDLYDFDRNQKVGLNDMVRIHRIAFGQEKPDLDHIQEIINWGDLDRDGQLSYSEFRTAVTRYETHIDPRSRRTRE
eukprot:TRINITY_DN6938_c0_g1_i1.p2 TRINITY_DN6938_c0_g1~~TRINITY_DN6938_c0_g1_i1.p2  ORF type:complete len:167 (+),score=86.77 TRINITY_DN6938_c0_g1_i1:131-631(+)